MMGYKVNIIETKNLTKYYGKSLGIHNVNLTIEQGEIFGFIGPNGAGKKCSPPVKIRLVGHTGNWHYFAEH